MTVAADWRRLTKVLLGVSLIAACAVAAMIHLVRVRHPKYAAGVGGLALSCVALLPGVWLMSTIAEYQMAISPDQAAMARLLTDGEEAASAIPLFVVWIGMTLAVILLAAGLIWSRTVPRWMPILLIVAFVALLASDEGVMGAIVSVALLVGLGAIGLTILRSSDGEWEAGDLSGARRTATSPPPAAVPAA